MLESIGDFDKEEWLRTKAEQDNEAEGTLVGIDCRKCKNKGHISIVRNGEIMWKICDCMKARKSLKQIEESGLKPLLDEYTFEKFIATETWQKNALSIAQNFVEYGENHWLFFGGMSGCVDCDTEYFNGTSWKKISEYCDGEKVLQYHPNSKKATLTIPLRYIVAPSEKLYLVKKERNSIDMCLSENHNFAYITSKGNMQKKPFREVMEMNNKNADGFHALVETAFNYSGKGIDLTDKEIRLMCAVIADGSFRPKLRLCTVNIKKERKKERLRMLLDGMQYKEYKRSNGYSNFRFYAPRREKEFTDFWYGCSKDQLEVVCDEIFYWDGSINGERKAFYSTSKKSADFIQFALSATGHRATISPDYHKEKICYTVTRSSFGSLVTFNGHSGKNKAEITEFVPKDKKQYCFTVKTGYLVLRRNGRIFITGNSGKSHLCTAICGELLKRGKGVRYMMWKDDATKLKSVITDSNEYGKLIDELKSVDVLYIDDFLKVQRGKQPTEGDINLAFEILNYRYANKSLTIISTEKTIDEILSLDDAIGGRIYQMSKNYSMNIAYDRMKNFRLRK